MLALEVTQDRGDARNPFRAVHAEELARGAGWIRQGAEQVEHGAHAELAPYRADVLHGQVVAGREQESDPELVDAPPDLLGAEVEAHARRLQDIGAPGAAGDRTIAMLGDSSPRGRHDEGRGRRDVEGSGAVTARPAGVHEVLRGGLHRNGQTPHDLRGRADLGGGLALGAQAHEESSQLRRCDLTAHDRLHGPGHLLVAEGLSLRKAGERETDIHRTCLGGHTRGAARVRRV